MSLLNNGVWVADDKVDNPTAIPTHTTPQADRYHLYVSLSCPFAHRVNLVVQYLGLPIDISSVSPEKLDGWAFDENYPDPIFGVKNLYEIYQRHNSQFSGVASVPVLWDKLDNQIASNSSADLALNLAENWQELATNKHNLVPSELKNEILELNQWLNAHITGKVNRVGFAKNQADYDNLLIELFDDLAILDNRLANQTYLFGDKMTLSDFFLFPTLVRFEKVYATLFKCSLKNLSEFKHLYRYLSDLYQIDGIKNTVDLDYIVTNFYYSFANLNPSRVVPKLPKLAWE